MKKLKWRGQYGGENGEFGWHKKEIGAVIKKYLAKKGCNKYLWLLLDNEQS